MTAAPAKAPARPRKSTGRAELTSDQQAQADAELAAAREANGTQPPPDVDLEGRDLEPTAGGDLWTAEAWQEVVDAERSTELAQRAPLTAAQLAGLELLRQPMPAHLLALKPVNVAKEGSKSTCGVCGSYSGPHRQHLTFAGHAAITDRLLAADPCWSWAPVTDPAVRGALPPGFWIELTVCGVTRLGYGDAEGKTGHTVPKELIGDALRNAAMRFGVGLELWHKGDLHAAAQDDAPAQNSSGRQAPSKAASGHQERPAAPQAPSGPPADAAPALHAQGYVTKMLEVTGMAATVALQRTAFEAELLEAQVDLPTDPPQRVKLADAFEQRKAWIKAQTERAAQQSDQS